MHNPGYYFWSGLCRINSDKNTKNNCTGNKNPTPHELEKNKNRYESFRKNTWLLCRSSYFLAPGCKIPATWSCHSLLHRPMSRAEPGKKHRRHIPIFNIFLPNTLNEFRFFDVFQFPEIHKNEKRRKNKKKKNRLKKDATPGQQSKYAGEHWIPGICIGPGLDQLGRGIKRNRSAPDL